MHYYKSSLRWKQRLNVVTDYYAMMESMVNLVNQGNNALLLLQVRLLDGNLVKPG